jgi:hypothetical protein
MRRGTKFRHTRFYHMTDTLLIIIFLPANIWNWFLENHILSAGLSWPEGIICWTVISRGYYLPSSQWLDCWTVIDRGYYLLDCHCPRVLSAGLSLLEDIICWTVIAWGYYLLDYHCPRILSAGLTARGYYLLDCHCLRVLSAALSLTEGIIRPVVSSRGYYPPSGQWFGIYMVY